MTATQSYSNDHVQAATALWVGLHAEFSGRGVVEPCRGIGFTLGGRRWLNTLSTKQHEFAAALKTTRD